MVAHEEEWAVAEVVATAVAIWHSFRRRCGFPRVLIKVFIVYDNSINVRKLAWCCFVYGIQNSFTVSKKLLENAKSRDGVSFLEVVVRMCMTLKLAYLPVKYF